MQDRNKITHAINYHFGYDFEKTVDFFTLSREDFLLEYEDDDITATHYNNTCLFWLNRVNMVDYIFKPIFQIEGRDILKIYKKKNLDPIDIFLLCQS